MHYVFTSMEFVNTWESRFLIQSVFLQRVAYRSAIATLLVVTLSNIPFTLSIHRCVLMMCAKASYLNKKRHSHSSIGTSSISICL